MSAVSRCRAVIGFVPLAALWLLLTGCVARQVTVHRLGQEAAYRSRVDNALTADRPGSDAGAVLRRYGLDQEYRKHPDSCLGALWAKALADDRRDALLAVSELCFLRAKELDRPRWRLGDRSRARDTYLAAALSAYVFLFGERDDLLPSAFDRRVRLACDLYNVALGRALSDADGRVTLRAETRPTPLGDVRVSVEDSDQLASFAALDAVFLADQFDVRGLEVRNRTSGLGTPVIAVAPRDSDRPLRQTVGATLLLFCDDPAAPGAAGLNATLRVVKAIDAQVVEIGGVTVPVESDMTAPIAYALNDPLVWKLGRRVFRLGQAPVHNGIYPAGPYVPGRVPVLFVHGTMSSPFLWADMWNSLRADPEIRRRCQFWFYFYESAGPLGVSAARLRESIAGTVAAMDPAGTDPALCQMVVIGHSQGGLLTKLTAVDTGESLVEGLTGKSIAELGLSAEDEALARRYGVFTPLPQVSRVVFISTPHRGSYLASGFGRVLVRRLVQLPVNLSQFGSLYTRLHERLTLPRQFHRLPTSVDGMSPDNPALLRLADIPMAAGVRAHSIIPVKGDAKPPAGKDGVVTYRSAHLDGVESEFVVRDGHSCQGNPLVIEEVRRILLEHVASGLDHMPAGRP